VLAGSQSICGIGGLNAKARIRADEAPALGALRCAGAEAGARTSRGAIGVVSGCGIRRVEWHNRFDLPREPG